MSLFDDPPTPRSPRGRPRRAAGGKSAGNTGPAKGSPSSPAPSSEDAGRGGDRGGERVVSVGALTRAIAGRMKAMGRLAVEGEVSRVTKAGSGHVYFTLKDEDAVLDCKIWRSVAGRALTAPLREGQRVVCHGALDVYAPRGTYSLIVERVERRGIGELLARLEELKAKLREKGWFDRSRPVPILPGTVGLVTSRNADALQDFLRTRSLRWPLYPVRMVHTRVQGEGASREIAAAIARLDASGVDAIVVARGGGSLEDLWCFNEFPVAEAIWNCSVPVITGVGHQTDTTLADLVADHRAHTPTDAAQTVIPDRRSLEDRIERAAGYLFEAMDRVLERRSERVLRIAERRTLRSADWLLDERAAQVERLGRRLSLAGGRGLEQAAARLERAVGRLARQSPAARLARLEERLDGIGSRLVRAPQQPASHRSERVAVLARSLEAVSPYAVLRRGYSITRPLAGGPPLRSGAEVAKGTVVETLLADGRLVSEVTEAEEGQEARRADTDAAGDGA